MVNAQTDTVGVLRAIENNSDTSSIKQTDTTFIMQKSAWGAVLKSAIIPGWGQIYNQSYWKAPIVWGFTAWFVGNWVYNNNKYTTNRNYYLANQYILNDQNASSASKSELSRAKRFRDFYRDQRDLFAIYLGITYVLNLVDAYVDAHMFDFTVKEDFLTNMPIYKINFKLNF
jgi:hypothetical protein